MLAVILNQHLIKKERAGRMQKLRIPPHPTTKQGILFLHRMGFPAQKKMKSFGWKEQNKDNINLLQYGEYYKEEIVNFV